MFSNNVYDKLKWIALVLIPALASLYFGLSQIWGFPLGEEVVGTLTVVDTFLGTLLGISNINYKKTADLREETTNGLEEGEE